MNWDKKLGRYTATYNNLEQYHKALENFDKAIEINPKDADYLHHHIAYIHFKLNNIQESQTNLNKALSIEREWQSLSLLGHLAFHAKQIEEAKTHYKEAIDLCNDWGKFEAAYKKDAEHIQNLQLDVNLYLSLLDELHAYWQGKQS